MKSQVAVNGSAIPVFTLREALFLLVHPIYFFLLAVRWANVTIGVHDSQETWCRDHLNG